MKQNYSKLKRMLWIVPIVLLLVVGGVRLFMSQASFGKLPEGERLARIEKSPNYQNGIFVNQEETKQITSDKSMFGMMLEFFVKKVEDKTPENEIPVVKTDLYALNADEDMFVWLGHSSLFLQLNGRRVAVDPVLLSASPLSFFNRPFKGTSVYAPKDLPDLDVLIITHDHWDHLDYNTIKQLKGRVGKVVCPLGVGAHFEHWGFQPETIIELDWYQSTEGTNGLKITAMPARHFSGRGLKGNKTQWASFVVQSSEKTLFLSGDSGYDKHFRDVKQQFGTIDLAFMENGQYDKDWRLIHTMPNELGNTILDLAPEKVMSIHNSKYALGKHAWYTPLKNVAEVADKLSLDLLTPKIGEPVLLNDNTQQFGRWWE